MGAFVQPGANFRYNWIESNDTFQDIELGATVDVGATFQVSDRLRLLVLSNIARLVAESPTDLSDIDFGISLLSQSTQVRIGAELAIGS